MTDFYPATAMPDSDWWEALWPRPDAVVARLGVDPSGEAIDLCCGDGLFTLPLTRIARAVTAIDLDPAMLEKTRAKLAAAGAANCETVLGEAYHVAVLVRRPVAFVLMANTFHGVPDKPRLVRAIAAALQARGRFAVINWHRRKREETVVLGQPRGPKTELRMTPAELAAVVEPEGLRRVGLIELPPYHYAAIFEKPAG